MKNGRQQIHIVIASAIILAILVLVYRTAERGNKRIDLTRDKIHSLAPETVEVLRRLERREVKIRAFFAEGDPARRELESRFKEIKTHVPHFHYAFYDPDRTPSEARRFHIDSYQTVRVESGDRIERFFGASEEELVNALIRLAHPRKAVLCFTRGHGEIPLSGKEGEERTHLSQWKAVLEEHPYEVREIQLLSDGLPSDCNVVIMAGPRYELAPREIDLLVRYQGRGMGFLFLIDPMDPGAGKSFTALLGGLGFELGQNVVIDKVSRIFGGDYLAPLVSQYAKHPMTRRFQAAAFFPIARTVSKARRVPEGVQAEELAWTHPGSWAETNLKKLEDGEADFDEKADLKGPVSLLATAEWGKAPKALRWVAAGDSDFLTDAYLKLAGNRDLALNMIQWLAQDDRWIAIRVKAPQFEPLFLRLPQSVGVAVFSLGVLPFTALAAGSLGILLRRPRSR